jgi:hypothetical protein
VTLNRFLTSLLCVLLTASFAASDEQNQILADSQSKANGALLAVEQSLDRHMTIFRNDLNVYDFHPPSIVIGSTPTSLWDVFSRKSSALSQFEFLDAFTPRCNSRETVYGIYTGDVIALCIFDSENFDPEISRKFISITLAHELFHAAQFSLLGINSLDEVKSSIDTLGPAWLLEGSAFYFGEFHGCPSCEGLEPNDLINGLRRISQDFSQEYEVLEHFDDSPSHSEALYYKGFLASLVLVRDHGDESLIEFYETLGAGEEWENAFHTSFGIKVDEFYSKIQG